MRDAVHIIEHALMSERTRDRLESARARGRTGGQKPRLTPRQAKIALDMYHQRGPTGDETTPFSRSPTSSASPATPSTATSSDMPLTLDLAAYECEPA